MVRNLCIPNGWPSRPARSWLKNTGPRESSLIARAMIGNSGAVTSRPSDEATTSKARLIIAVERDGSQVSYSSTGRSATRERRTGPARPCSGEITLSFTWRSRQRATSPPTSPGSMRSDATITRSTSPIALLEWPRLGVVEQLQMHVGEQLELAADHLREVARAEHRRDLARRGHPPDPAREPPQHEVAAPRRRRTRSRSRRAHRAGGRLGQDQRQRHRRRSPPRRRSPEPRRRSGGGSRRGRGHTDRAASRSPPTREAARARRRRARSRRR